MSKSPDQKLKLLFLARVLTSQTDEAHAMTLDEIRSALLSYDVQAERKDSAFIKTDDTHFKICVDVTVSPQFYGWLCGLGVDSKVLESESVVGDFRLYICGVMEMYKGECIILVLRLHISNVHCEMIVNSDC